MGAGASAEEASKVLQGASAEELQAAIAALPEEARGKIQDAIDGAEAVAGEEDWGVFKHKGPYSEQRDKGLFGPAPDYSTREAWLWYGEDGTTGPEFVADGIEKPPVADRVADCFFIHPTSYFGDLWNMPLTDTSASDKTTYFLETDASTFNGSCRMYCPRYRQETCAGFAWPEEGRQGYELAYSDLKVAFEHYLKDRHDGRPLVLASHSQGSFNMTRLLQECVEGKEVMKHIVAIYCLGAWVPLNLFEGADAVFKDIKLCKAPDSTGIFVHWNLDSTERVEQRRSDGKWDMQLGQWRAGEWMPIDGLAVVGTNPLTWASNGMGGISDPAVQQGVMPKCTTDDSALADMNDLGEKLCTDKNLGLKVTSLAKFDQVEVQALLDKQELGSFCLKVDDKTGDLVTPLPKECGPPEAGYEAMNFLLFYFNIRENLRTRLDAFVK